MAVPTPAHVRINIIGTLPGNEVFAFGFDSLGEAGNQTTLDANTAAVKTYLQGSTGSVLDLKSLLNNLSAFTQVKGYSYGAGATSASFISTQFLNVAGTGTIIHPNQVALVASLRSVTAGRRSRGRMYLPANGIPLAGQAQVNNAVVTAVATAVKDLLKAQGSAIDPVVISRVAQAAYPVRQVVVDSRLDTQRGRANKQASLFVGTQAVPAPV